MRNTVDGQDGVNIGANQGQNVDDGQNYTNMGTNQWQVNSFGNPVNTQGAGMDANQGPTSNYNGVTSPQVDFNANQGQVNVPKNTTGNRKVIIGIVIGLLGLLVLGGIVFSITIGSLITSMVERDAQEQTTIYEGEQNGLEQTATYKGKQNGLEMTVTYYAKGDKVYKQTTETIIPYSSVGASSEEEARALLDSAVKDAQNLNIKGYEDQIEFGEDAATEYVVLNFEEISPEDLNKIPGYLSGDASQGVSLQRSAQYLEGIGFTKVE